MRYALMCSYVSIALAALVFDGMRRDVSIPFSDDLHTNTAEPGVIQTLVKSHVNLASGPAESSARLRATCSDLRLSRTE